MGFTGPSPPNSTTPLRRALQACREGHGPAVGSWLTLPGFTLARTIAATGPDVRAILCGLTTDTFADLSPVGVGRL